MSNPPITTMDLVFVAGILWGFFVNAIFRVSLRLGLEDWIIKKLNEIWGAKK